MRLSQVLAIIWLILPLLVGVIFIIRQNRFCFLLPFCISTGLGYILVVTSPQISDKELKNRLYALDTNSDGVFSGDEITPEVKRRLENVSTDTGRTFAPITGIPMSAIWTSINLCIIGLICMGIQKIRKKWLTGSCS